MLKLLQLLVCFSLQCTALIRSSSYNCLRSGIQEWKLLVRKKVCILRTTRRWFRSMWRVHTGTNIDIYPSLNPKVYPATISSPLQLLHELVNMLMIIMMYPEMMKNSLCWNMWLKWCPDDVIKQHTDWLPQGSTQTHWLSEHRTRANESKSQCFSLWLYGVSQYILDSGYYWLVVSAGGNPLIVPLSLKCDMLNILYHTPWCQCGG